MSLDLETKSTLDALQALIASEKFRNEVDVFMDKYTSEYEDLDLCSENKLCFTSHHEEFQAWAEKMLEDAASLEKIAVLCERLPHLMGGGEASKEHMDSLGKYEKTLSILFAFTDFQQFRAMMQTRATGHKKKKPSAMVSLEAFEAGRTTVKDMLEIAKKLEDAAADGA